MGGNDLLGYSSGCSTSLRRGRLVCKAVTGGRNWRTKRHHGMLFTVLLSIVAICLYNPDHLLGVECPEWVGPSSPINQQWWMPHRVYYMPILWKCFLNSVAVFSETTLISKRRKKNLRKIKDNQYSHTKQNNTQNIIKLISTLLRTMTYKNKHTCFEESSKKEGGMDVMCVCVAL